MNKAMNTGTSDVVVRIDVKRKTRTFVIRVIIDTFPVNRMRWSNQNTLNEIFKSVSS